MAKKKEFAVIGLGRFGSNVALTLEMHGHHVLGIDVNEDIVQHMAHQITQAVVLDSTNEDALRAVEIAAFDTVIVAIGSDFENNLMTTVSLKQMGVQHVICKAPTRRQEQILLRVGADRVIRPEHEAGVRLAEELIAPSMLEHFVLGADTDFTIAEFVVPTSLTCKSLVQSNIRGKYGVNVLVIKRGNDVLVSPPANAILQPGDAVVILGHQEDVLRFSRLQ